MITDIFFFLIGAVLKIIVGVFQGFNFLVPDAIAESITSLLSNLRYLQGVLPIDDMLQALGTLVTFFGFWYLAKLFLKVYHMLPWVGKKVKLHGGA